MTVLVTGATGVLGRALIPRLIAGRHRVLAIARNASTAGLPAEVEAIDVNLLEDDLLELVRGCDAVIHIATAIPSEPSAFGAWDTTAWLRTEGTRRLLTAALPVVFGGYVQQASSWPTVTAATPGSTRLHHSTIHRNGPQSADPSSQWRK